MVFYAYEITLAGGKVEQASSSFNKRSIDFFRKYCGIKMFEREKGGEVDGNIWPR